MKPSIQRPWLILLFFLTGLVSLVYEIAWVRQATLTFGVSLNAYSAVLAAYIGGTVLGSVMDCLLTAAILLQTGRKFDILTTNAILRYTGCSHTLLPVNAETQELIQQIQQQAVRGGH